MAENLQVFDSYSPNEDLNRIAAMDCGESLYLDHRDPKTFGQLGRARVD